MKYVRTESNIMEYDGVSERWYERHKGYKFADTIEELCDHLVVIEKETGFMPHLQHRFLGDLFLSSGYQKRFEQKKLIVYGAIWTDIGLIYVAKMNDKGKLELL